MAKISEAITGKRHQNRIVFWAVLIGTALLVWCLSHAIGLKTVHGWATALNGWLLFVLMALLPLVGVPMSILGVMAGAKFGSWAAFAVTGGAVSINLILSWWIARRWLRKPVEKMLQRADYKIPHLEKGEYAGICVVTALVPGPSYTLKNYFLALSNLPFRLIFWIGLPAHMLAMSPGILFGQFTGAMTWIKVVFLTAYTLLLVGASHYLFRRIRSRYRPAA